MSAGFINLAEVMGYVGKMPKATKMKNGELVVHLSIGTTEKWTDKETNEVREHTNWHNIAFFGKVGNVVMEHVKTGSRILVKGKLQTRKSTDKDGIDRYNTSIVVSGRGSELHLLGDPRDKSEEDTSQDHDLHPTDAYDGVVPSDDYARASQGVVS